jgi:hypothetical protein
MAAPALEMWSSSHAPARERAGFWFAVAHKLGSQDFMELFHPSIAAASVDNACLCFAPDGGRPGPLRSSSVICPAKTTVRFAAIPDIATDAVCGL